MHVGLLSFQDGTALPVTQIARIAEDLGFESLFLPDHSHIPAEVQSVHAGPAFAGQHRRWAGIFDPMACLAAAAAVTDVLKLGTAVCLVNERDPIGLAKSVATVDHLSGGRVILGVAPGWNAEAMRHHGVDASRRGAVFRERMLAMQRIWQDDVASFVGEFVQFEAIWSDPKPIQRPWPPVLIGGHGPGVLGRVAELGDGWMPSWREVADDLPSRAAQLQSQPPGVSGRRKELTVIDEYPPATLAGQPDALRHRDRLRAMGVDRWLLRIPKGSESEIIESLRRFETLIPEESTVT